MAHPSEAPGAVLQADVLPPPGAPELGAEKQLNRYCYLWVSSS